MARAKLGIGIDFGTSNSSAALWSGGDVISIVLDNAAADGSVMPTAIALDRHYKGIVGFAAIRRYIQSNAGRPVQLEQEALGEIEVTFGETGTFKGVEERSGDTTQHVTVHGLIDKNETVRLFRGLKRYLAMEDMDTLKVFEKRYRLVALVAHLLKHITDKVKGATSIDDVVVYVGSPIRFERAGEAGNSVAFDRLREALTYSGIQNYRFYPEPVAAATSFILSGGKKPKGAVLTCDFGGGTIDFCVLKHRGNRMAVAATHGLAIGGDFINQLIYRRKVFPELGQGALMTAGRRAGSAGHLFPFSMFETGLLNWNMTYTLNEAKFMQVIHTGLKEEGPTKAKIERLSAVIRQNLSYLIVCAIEEAKIRLAKSHRAVIQVPELDLDVSITQKELATILREPVLDPIRDAIRDVLRTASIAPEEVEVVVRTGGSSRLTAFVALIEELFPGRSVEYDVYASIAAGLAIASGRRSKWAGSW